MIDVVVVGAGLAGLTCAQDLTRSGLECTVVEAADGVGGRVRTDLGDGYRLDRGFQILLTAYPQVRSRLDLDALDVAPFEPGAHVWTGDRFHRLADPLRRPTLALQTLGAPIGGLADKLRLARLVADVGLRSVPDLLRRPDMSTDERLRAAGFSDTMIERFWRPLFSGIQLDPDLEVSRRRFDAILRMLAVGGTGVPARAWARSPTSSPPPFPTGRSDSTPPSASSPPPAPTPASSSMAVSASTPVPWWSRPTGRPRIVSLAHGSPIPAREPPRPAGSPPPRRPGRVRS